MNGASVEAQRYAANIKNGTGSAQTFATNQKVIQTSMNETSVASKAAAIGINLFKAALNTLIFFAVIEGIQLLVKGIDNLILTAEEAEEKAENLRNSMQSFFDEVQSGQQTISSISDRFSELSNHVTETGENIDLTKDEYSEYLDICNQVKSIMPELVTGYTNEGNAIITLKDNVDSLTESYKENIRAKAAAFVTNGDDDGNTIQSFFDDYKIFTEGEGGLFAPSASGLWNNKSTDYEDYYGYDKIHEWLSEVADLSLKDLQNLQKGTTQATYLYALLKENGYELANITEDNYEAVHDVLDTRLTSLEGEMATRVSNVKMSLQQMLYADRDYWDIDNKEALSAIDSLFSSVDAEFIKQNNLLGQTALQSFESNVIRLFEDKNTQQSMIDIYAPQGTEESIEDYSKRVNNAIKNVQDYAKENNIDISLDFGDVTGDVETLQKQYDDAISKFTDNETQSLEDLKTKYQEAIDKRKELYSGSNYVGNVDINNRPVVINDDGSYSTTSTSFQEKWVGDEENGSYKIIHFTPILPDGTILEGEALNEYIDKILNSSDSLEADSPKNGGYGIVYKVDTEVNGKKITDDNLDEAFGVADAWDVEMHNLQDKMYRDEAEIKSAIEKFGNGSEVDLEKFFKDNSINTTEEIDYWNEVTKGARTAEEAVRMYNEAKNQNGNKTDISFSDIFSLKDAKDELTNLGKISESIDTIQNAYKTLNDAIEEYNENGSFSVDTLQSVIELGDDWLDYLVDEEGNLKLDKESLEALTKSRLEDMRVQTINNLIDNVSKINDDVSAKEYLKSTNYAVAKSYEELTEKTLAYTALIDSGVSEDIADAVIEKAQSDIQKINKLFENVDLSSTSLSGGGGSSTSTKKEYKELFDFFERRVDVLNDSLDLLKSNMENVNGSFAKNNLLNAQSSIYQEQIRNYTDALTMYQREADKILATLPADIAEKIKNGVVDLTTFMGEPSEAVVKAMKDYVGWSDAISNCQNQLAELKKTLEDLELSKFSNIIEDFTSQFDIRENSKNLIDQTKEWIESSGQLIGDSFFSSQIEQSQKQLLLLEQEKAKLVEQMNSALASGNVAVGSEAFLSMIDSLSEVESSIIDVKTELESLDTELKNLHWENLDRVSDRFSDISEEIDNLIGLIDDIDVSDKNGNWSEEGLVQLGLYSQEYERATYASQIYAEEIEKLNQAYINGEYSLLEYQERLSSLTEEQWNNIDASQEALDSIKQLNEERVNSTVDGINEEIEKYEELINAQIDALNSRKELEDYKKSISDKTKDINKLQREISAMEMDSSASTKALRLKKQEELQEALDELEQMQRDNSIEEQKKGLETQLKDYQASRESEIETLEDSLRDEQKLITQSFEVVKQNASTIGQQISNIAKQHGVTVSNTLISSWKQGENAIASYGSVLSSQSSAFIGNIMSVENEVWNLQNKANETAYSLAYMFSSQSDNLVNELTNSYNAEGNLYNMTNALQQSLINTLERGYDVSKIVGALNSIGDTADRVGKKLGDYQESKPFEGFDDLLTNDVGKNVGANLDAITPVNTNKNTNNQPKSDKYRLVDTTNSRVIKDNLTLEEIIQLQRNPSALTHAKIEKYASGTRNSKGSIIITDENGYELKLPKLSSGNYTIANEGSQILTKAQTDNIFDWAKFNPVDFMPSFKPIDLPKSSNIHKPIQIHNTITFTGAVNDANNFAKQIAQIADKQVTKSWKEFSDSVKY